MSISIGLNVVAIGRILLLVSVVAAKYYFINKNVKELKTEKSGLPVFTYIHMSNH